ncbi:MAG: hypothetical protein ACR2FN_01680 [Chitinophagaceae bacterium]
MENTISKIKNDITKFAKRKNKNANNDDIIKNAGIWENKKINIEIIREKAWPKR